MDLVRKNTKKYYFKNLNRALAFVENLFLGFVLTFEKETDCDFFT